MVDQQVPGAQPVRAMWGTTDDVPEALDDPEPTHVPRLARILDIPLAIDQPASPPRHDPS